MKKRFMNSEEFPKKKFNTPEKEAKSKRRKKIYSKTCFFRHSEER